jgi:hypothetical protein
MLKANSIQNFIPLKFRELLAEECKEGPSFNKTVIITMSSFYLLCRCSLFLLLISVACLHDHVCVRKKKNYCVRSNSDVLDYVHKNRCTWNTNFFFYFPWKSTCKFAYDSHCIELSDYILLILSRSCGYSESKIILMVIKALSLSILIWTSLSDWCLLEKGEKRDKFHFRLGVWKIHSFWEFCYKLTWEMTVCLSLSLSLWLTGGPDMCLC